MDREAVTKQMKALKAKGKAAKKAGKRDNALAFRNAARRLTRQLKASAPRGSALHGLKKEGGEEAKASEPAAS